MTNNTKLSKGNNMPNNDNTGTEVSTVTIKTDKRDSIVQDTVSPKRSPAKGAINAKYVGPTAVGNIRYPTFSIEGDSLDRKALVKGDKVSLITAELTLTGEFVKLAGDNNANLVLDKVQAKANKTPKL